MSRKASDSHHGLNDIVGFALLTAAVLLLVSQLSFDRFDLSFFRDPHNKPVHNWIGILGAYIGWFTFLMLGFAAYLLPVVFAAFGLGYLLNFMHYLRERLRWSLIWAAVLFVALTGILHILGFERVFGDGYVNIGSQNAGGWIGYATYGQTKNYEFGFSLLGPIGATIVYASLGVISLLFLTNFHLGEWIRALLTREPSAAVAAEEEGKSREEIVLERKARDLEKQAKKLQ